MEDKKFKVIIVEDVKLELKGTEEIFRHGKSPIQVIGTAMRPRVNSEHDKAGVSLTWYCWI